MRRNDRRKHPREKIFSKEFSILITFLLIASIASGIVFGIRAYSCTQESRKFQALIDRNQAKEKSLSEQRSALENKSYEELMEEAARGYGYCYPDENVYIIGY